MGLLLRCTKADAVGRVFHRSLFSKMRGLEDCNSKNIFINPKSISIGEQSFPSDEFTNVTAPILAKLQADLCNTPHHPLNVVKSIIEHYFKKERLAVKGTAPLQFGIFEGISPIVSAKENFDDLCFPEKHVGRNPSDTYYLNRDFLLRTHTTAHEIELMKLSKAFVHFGDNYRRDEIDAVHFPVFHQVELVRRFEDRELATAVHLRDELSGNLRSRTINASLGYQKVHLNQSDKVQLAILNLQQELEGLFRVLFGPNIPYEWIPGEFPFTFPSLECEIEYADKKLEICGCGILQDSIMEKAGYPGQISWACGLGLERLAMILFKIPDIRLFWTKDERFFKQFQCYYPLKESFLDEPYRFIQPFVPYSKYPPIARDVSFWLSRHDPLKTPDLSKTGTACKIGSQFHPNTLYEIVREEAGELVESVSLLDSFQHPEAKVESQCYRIIYRCMDRNLTDSEINTIQSRIRARISDAFAVTVR